MWSTTGANTIAPRDECGSGRTVSHSCSSTDASEPTESDNDDDILGLISSSLDRFNAQLHYNPQPGMSIPISHYPNCPGVLASDIGAGISTNISNSVSIHFHKNLLFLIISYQSLHGYRATSYELFYAK